MKKEDLKPIEFYKNAHEELIAFDGEQYYEVTPCKYSISATSFLKDGFLFTPIKMED